MKQIQASNSLPVLQVLQNSFLHHLYKLIEENLGVSPLNVDFLANQMAVSRSTLNRKLSILTGKSAHKLIKDQRLERAKELLNSGKNVSETAYLSGFETPSYFIQCFKEVYKITPKEYSKINLNCSF